MTTDYIRHIRVLEHELKTRDGVRIVPHTLVEVVIDGAALDALALRAARARGRRAKSGPVVAKARKG